MGSEFSTGAFVLVFVLGAAAKAGVTEAVRSLAAVAMDSAAAEATERLASDFSVPWAIDLELADRKNKFLPERRKSLSSLLRLTILLDPIRFPSCFLRGSVATDIRVLPAAVFDSLLLASDVVVPFASLCMLLELLLETKVLVEL